MLSLASTRQPYVYLQMDNNEKAFTILNETYRQVIQNQIGGLLNTSVLMNLGVAHGKIGEYHSVIRLLTEAHEINQATSTLFKEGQIFMALGICYRRVSQCEKAKECYKKALQYFEMIDDLENRAGTYTNLGVLYATK